MVSAEDLLLILRRVIFAQPQIMPVRRRKNQHKSILSNYLPLQSGIVLVLENPPNVLGAAGRLVHEVPAGFEEGVSCLHLDRY